MIITYLCFYEILEPQGSHSNIRFAAIYQYVKKLATKSDRLVPTQKFWRLFLKSKTEEG